MPYEHLIYETDGPVALLTLNRPEALNALSPDLERELHEALDEADRDPAVRSIVMTAPGAHSARATTWRRAAGATPRSRGYARR
ncbi:MAG: enoyl-CoA hydratase/isomerase family protein [Dehalococcoidia bacterium]